MVRAQLLVERGTLRDRSEDWGELDFLALPSPGDRVTAERDGKTQFLTVICIHHQPAAAGGGEPRAAVVARWTGSQ